MPNITIFTHKNSLHSALFSHDLREVDMSDTVGEPIRRIVSSDVITRILESKGEEFEKLLVSLL